MASKCSSSWVSIVSARFWSAAMFRVSSSCRWRIPPSWRSSSFQLSIKCLEMMTRTILRTHSTKSGMFSAPTSKRLPQFWKLLSPKPQLQAAAPSKSWTLWMIISSRPPSSAIFQLAYQLISNLAWTWPEPWTISHLPSQMWSLCLNPEKMLSRCKEKSRQFRAFYSEL